MTLSLYIDPGVHHLACAFYWNAGLLAVHSIPTESFLSPVPCPLLAIPSQLARVVCEKPVIRKGAKGEKDPNDCVDLFGAARFAEAALRVQGAPPFEYHYPEKWKGQEKKPIHHRRLWSVLSSAERDVFARHCGYSAPDIVAKIEKACQVLATTGKVRGYSWDAHNLFDAVGIGLWRLGRVGIAGHRFS